MSAGEELSSTFEALISRKDYGGLEESWMAALDGIEGGDVPPMAPFVEAADAFLEGGQKGRADVLLDLTIPLYQENAEKTELLPLLRRRCLAAPDDVGVREEFKTCFCEVYGPTSVEVVYLKFVELEQSSDVKQSFAALDRWMRFRVGAYVFHASGWGAGRIVSIDALLQQAIVDLEQRQQHRMALEAIGSVLEPLGDSHFLVYKLQGGDEIRRMVADEPEALISSVLAAFRNPMALKDIKPHLCPEYIASGEWSKWWNRTKKRLRAAGYFRIGDRAPYLVERLEQAVSYEDELLKEYSGLTAEKKRALTKKVLKDGGKEFPRLCEAIVGELTATMTESPGPAAVAAAYYIQTFRPPGAGEAGEGEPIDRALRSCSDPVGALRALGGAEEQRRVTPYLPAVLGEDWPQAAVELWQSSSDAVRDALLELTENDAPEVASLTESLTSRIGTAMAAPRLGADLLVWSFKKYLRGARSAVFRSLQELDAVDRFLRVLDLLDHVGRRADREGKDRVAKLLTKSRSLVSGKSNALFTELLKSVDVERGRTVHSRILRCRPLVESARLGLLERLTRAIPELTNIEDKPIWDEHTVYVTASGRSARVEELREIMDVKLPEVFEDIGRAAAFGDLSENAEYTAALERRDFLTKKAETIQEELKGVTLIVPDMLKEGEVTLGAKITVRDLDDEKNLVFRVLGPWDGGPDEGVLSYKSPIGRAFLGAKIGDTVEAQLPGGTRRFDVLSIESGI